MLKIAITNSCNKIKSRLPSPSSSSSLSWTWCSNQELLAAQAVLYAVVSNQPTIPCQPPTNPPAPNSPTNPCHLPNLPFRPLNKLSLSQNAIARNLHNNDHQYLHIHPSIIVFKECSFSFLLNCVSVNGPKMYFFSLYFS